MRYRAPGGDNMKAKVATDRPWLFAIIVFTLLFVQIAVASNLDKNKSRVEELFLWRVSDSLGLKPNEEAEFNRIVKKSRESKQALDVKIAETLRKMESANSEKEHATLLGEYKKMLKEYNSCQTQELEQLEKLFGPQKLSQYLVLKDKLLAKLKDALTEGKSQTKGKLKDPKVINEP